MDIDRYSIILAIETHFLYPIIILLGISVVISVALSVLKVRILPPFVIEIIAGIALGTVLNRYFVAHDYKPIVDGIFVIGFALIMFLSGYDINLDILSDHERTSSHHVNVKRLSFILLTLVYGLALILSFIFLSYFQNKTTGLLLLTITLASSFAGIIAPLVCAERLNHTGWGSIMITFSIISELISVISLTIVMIVINVSFENLWGYVIIAGVFVLLTLGLRIRPRRRVEAGLVYLRTRMVVFALAIAVVMSEFAGGEYVLGAFLLGVLLKTLGIRERKIKHIEHLGFGLFIPMFFVIVGTKIDILHFIEAPKMFLLVLGLFICFIIVKLPLLFLLKWYSRKTVITSIFLSACTLVVAITADHIGVESGAFTHYFGESLIMASILTTIVAPIVFEINFPKTIRLIRTRERGITYGRHP